MATPLTLFPHLSEADQYVAVVCEGTLLAKRYEEEDTVHLYQMEDGYLVEVYYDWTINQLQRAEAFPLGDRERLDNYESYIKLPDLGE